MKKFAFMAALAAVPMLGALFMAPSAFADSPGQLSNSPSNYKVRNVTTNGSYAQTASATCNETVKYSITLSNSDFGLLRDLKVNANMASGNIAASATNANNQVTSVSGNAKVTVANGSLSYVPGTTVRITSDGATTTPLADGITTGGVNAGELKGSTAVFVQFQAKVKCDTPEVKNIQVCELATKKIITIKESDFDSSKHSMNLADCAEEGELVVCELETKKIVTIKEGEFNEEKYTKDLSKCEDTPATPVTPSTPAELPQTGAEGVFGLVAAMVTAAGVYAVRARTNLLG